MVMLLLSEGLQNSAPGVMIIRRVDQKLGQPGHIPGGWNGLS